MRRSAPAIVRLACRCPSAYKRRVGGLPAQGRGDGMSERDTKPGGSAKPEAPGLSPAKAAAEARLAASLRANLQRRKAQARARAAGGDKVADAVGQGGGATPPGEAPD
jgi:hypothetical protein